MKWRILEIMLDAFIIFLVIKLMCSFHVKHSSITTPRNVVSFINRHNRKTLNKHTRQTNLTNTDLIRQCICRQTNTCPAEGKCLTKGVVYQAEVSTDDNKPVKYIRVTADNFKTRYRNHTKSFTNKKYSTETELSEHVWKLKAAKKPFTITWSLLKNVPAYKAGSRRCNLCLKEKLTIMKN